MSAAGLFANPKNPDIPGSDDFKGLIIHPTQWPTDLDLRGKKVAILGNGSTGVQLLAPVAEKAEKIYMYQRTPQWISPRDKYGKEVEPEIHWLTSNMPGYWNWCRYTSIMHLFNFHKDYLIVDTEWQKQGGQITKQSDTVRHFLINYITDQVGGRQDLIDKLIPDYAPMVRRPVVDNGWYKALTRENAELITQDIVRVTETGIETSDGEFREVDIIVTATGFEIVKYLWPAEYIGRGGVNLHERWANLVVDSVGGSTLEGSIAALAYRGRISWVGRAGREVTPPEVWPIMQKNASITGVFLGIEMAFNPQRTHPLIGSLLQRIADQKLSVVLDKKFPLSQASEAHRYIESRQAFGRVLLIP